MEGFNSLLVKFSFYGIQNKTLDWIQSFLAKRFNCSQLIMVDGEQSEPVPVTSAISGMPQGSYFLFVYMTCQSTSPQHVVFSLMTLMSSTATITSVDGTALWQQDLTTLELCEKRWGMSFNLTRHKTINVTREIQKNSQTVILLMKKTSGANLVPLSEQPYSAIWIRSACPYGMFHKGLLL